MSETAAALGASDVLTFLREARLEVQGRIATASNATLFVTLELEGVLGAAVYKPVAGERPLWDFPDGTLAAREVSAYVVSEATGWHLVPPTVMREASFGPGMCQLWVDVDAEVELVDLVPAGGVPTGWLHVLDAMDGGGDEVSLVHADRPELARMAVLDAVLNNADRKGGHVLVSEDGQVRGVDHGVCFSEDEKLRTVLWGWAGEPLPEDCVEVLERLAGELEPDSGSTLRADLLALLTPPEVAATARRVRRLLSRRRFPVPGRGWPSIPWPAF